MSIKFFKFLQNFRSQNPKQLAERQSEHGEEIALDAFDENAAALLNAVSARLVQRLAGGDVPLDLALGHRAEVHGRSRHDGLCFPAPEDGQAGVHRMAAAGQGAQHRRGVGGVGGHLVQALARAGVGHITVIDDDVVSVSNINRQAVAMDSTVGRPKVEVIAEQVRDINPACEVTPLRLFYTPENAETLDLARFDAIADCIDTVKAKVTLICRAKEAGVYAISAMGAGNKLDPTRFEVADIAKTSVCPLCRVMRTQLKKRGVAHHTVVYSTEEPLKIVADEQNGRHAPGSVSFVPPVVGLIMAGEIIKTIARGNA